MLLRELEYVIVDLETTGFYADAGDEIIEIGAILVADGKITDEKFHSLVNPGRKIPPASTNVHGIKDEDVSGAPSLKSVLPKFTQFVGGRILVAHNAKFDMSFILRGLDRNGLPFRQNIIIDTVAVSKFIFPYEQYHNLDVVMARLNISKTGDRHRSLDDCRYTAMALLEFLDLLDKQGVKELTEIESTFVKPESVFKSQKPKNLGLFSQKT